jgi:hypothetical protein
VESCRRELADVSAARVEGVIASVGRHDEALARWMRVAADGLAAGEGKELITQAGLQQYLWYDLPNRHPDDTWRPVAEAVAVLLSLLGLDRYATIARSATTAAVLDAWEGAPGKGFAAFRAASEASGVEPPDTGPLAWGEAYGPPVQPQPAQRPVQHAGLATSQRPRAARLAWRARQLVPWLPA